MRNVRGKNAGKPVRKAPVKQTSVKEPGKVVKAVAFAKAPSTKGARRAVVKRARIGAMTPDDFEAAISLALGGRGWQQSFAAGLGLAKSTVSRYLAGVVPIPQHIALIVEMIQSLRNHGLPVPDAFTIKK